MFIKPGRITYKVDRLYIDDITTYIDSDSSTNLTLTDAVTGTKTLAQLAALGNDEKVGIDSGATEGYLGAASSDGVLRVGSNLSYVDGGDYVTLDLATSPSVTGSYTANSGGATGEIGLNLYSINSTYSTIAQSDAEGIANSSDLRIGLDETLRTLIICDRGDIDTDFGLSAAGDPTVYIYSASAAFRAGLNFYALSLRGGDFALLAASGTTPVNFNVAVDHSADNLFRFGSSANIELTDANGQQSWMYIEPKVLQTGTAAFDGLYLNINGTVTDTYGDGSTGDGNNLLRLGDNGTTIYKWNLTGAYHFSETTTPTAVTDYGAIYTKTDDILYFQDGAGVEHKIGGSTPVFKSYMVTTQGLGANPDVYVGGFYDASVADANLTQGGTTATYGTANKAEGAHAFLVAADTGTASGGSGAVTIVVSGISITDTGVRNGTDSETIVADITAMSTDEYFETSKKWLGQVTYTLTVGATGHSAYAADFNYGFCKYEDYGNRDFKVTDFEVCGFAGANDTNFDVILYHHSSTGWTYHATAFVPGGTIICQLSTDYSSDDQLFSAESFAYKRSGLTTSVDGDGNEGVVGRIISTANNAVEYATVIVGAEL